MVKGKIHSIETLGTVDGPGIRFVLFLQGCPMRCRYCHNPDTWEFNGGSEKGVGEILAEIRKYRHYFGPEGGVTVSGGEPLAQIDFVINLFKELKAENIHTCIDTSGVTFNNSPGVVKKYDELIKYTDLVLLDIKHIDADKHEWLTGHRNNNILDFAKYLDKNKIPVWIRHVLVPGITTDEKSLMALKDFVKELKNVEKIETLPYHTMGVPKYKELGIKYLLDGVNPPTSEQINAANKILKGEN